MKLYGKQLNAKEMTALSNFCVLETALEEFYEKNKTEDQKSQISNFFSDILENENSIKKLSGLSIVSVLRLYKTLLNRTNITMKISELPNGFIKPELLKSNHFIELPQNIIALVLPEGYTINLLSIFDTQFIVDESNWVLKCVACTRDHLTISITKDSKKNVWALEQKCLTIEKPISFDFFTPAISTAIEKGFMPAVYMYFKEASQVASEKLPNKIINQLSNLVYSHRFLPKWKSKKVTKDKLISIVKEISARRMEVRGDNKMGVNAGEVLSQIGVNKEGFTDEANVLNYDRETACQSARVSRKREEVKVELNAWPNSSVHEQEKNKFNVPFNSAPSTSDQGIPDFVVNSSPSVLDQLGINAVKEKWVCSNCKYQNDRSGGNLCQKCKIISHCHACNIDHSSQNDHCGTCKISFYLNS